MGKKNPHFDRALEVNAMSKPLTKEQAQLKKLRRIEQKGLKQLLVHRFLHHYGYDKGPITARAIVDDIIQLIDQYFLVSPHRDDHLGQYLLYGQLTWMAVPIEERPKKYQSIAETQLKPVVLSFLTDDDVAHIAHGFDSKSLRKKRLLRWVDEAFDQGALLTQLDLAILLGVCDAVVSQYVNEIQTEIGRLLPTRGNIHDLSGAITHKREIITLYLEGYLTPDIALKTQHSNEAVDRYIRDYHRVETLWRHGITDLDTMSHLSRLAKRVIQQYIDLLPEKIRRTSLSSSPQRLDNVENSVTLSSSGEMEASSAEEQLAKG
jgi:predicted transcriptional regulator